MVQHLAKVQSTANVYFRTQNSDWSGIYIGLADRVPVVELVTNQKLGLPIAMGSRSIIHEWGPNSVAKVPKDSTPEGWMRFEASYTAALHKCGAPVPEVFGIALINGREASIMERIHGPSMWEAMIDSPGEVASFGRQLGDLHLQLLAIRPPILLPSQRSRLACKIRHAARSVDNGILHALDLIPPCRPISLCHGDFHPKNVLLSSTGPVVVDWFDVSRGDALGDVARTSLLLGGHHADSEAAHLPGAAPLLLSELHDTYLLSVLTGLGATTPQLGDWRIVEAAARIAEDVDQQALLNLLRSANIL